MKNIIRTLNKILIKEERKQLGWLIVLMVILAVFETVGVSLIVPMVSIIMDPLFIENTPWAVVLCRILHITNVEDFVKLFLLGMVAVYFIKGAFSVYVNYRKNQFVYKNQIRVQRSLMQIYVKKPYEYYLDHSTAELIQLINNSVPRTYVVLGEFVNLATQTIISIALTLAVFAVQPIMAICVGGILLLEMLIVFKVLKVKTVELGRREHAEYPHVSKWLIQTVEGIKETKINQKEVYYCTQYGRHADSMAKYNAQKLTLHTVPTAMIESITIGSVMFILVFMINIGYDIQSLIPALSAFAVAAMKLLPAANKISSYLTGIPNFTADVNQVYNFYASDSSNILKTIPSTQSFNKSQIQSMPFNECGLENVSYHYPHSKEWVLQNASLSIKAGESIGIVGTSGSGKTTSVDILLGLLDPQKGCVICDGVDIRENYSQWLSRISYIPQAIFMVDDSIAANVAYGLEESDRDEKEIWRALEEAQLTEFIKSLPDGIHTQIGERGVRLSGGQRQRIGIARALYNNPEILILDEATSALDNETEAAIMDAINALHGQKTLIIIAHRLTTIERCDKVYRVADGKIVEEI